MELSLLKKAKKQLEEYFEGKHRGGNQANV